MKFPLTIHLRGISESQAVRDGIEKQAAKLEKFCNHILECRVLAEKPHQNHRHGNLFRVRVDIKVPGKDVIVSRHPAKKHAHEDLYVAVRDAFNAVTRKLEDYVRERRGDVKSHIRPGDGINSAAV